MTCLGTKREREDEDEFSSSSSFSPVHARANSAMQLTRSGKWTIDEENFANRLVNEFEMGTLVDCEEGCTLRSYLARRLNCAPMRISKKFAGRCIGKLVFNRKKGIDDDDHQSACLSDLEDRFNRSNHQGLISPRGITGFASPRRAGISSNNFKLVASYSSDDHTDGSNSGHESDENSRNGNKQFAERGVKTFNPCFSHPRPSGYTSFLAKYRTSSTQLAPTAPNPIQTQLFQYAWNVGPDERALEEANEWKELLSGLSCGPPSPEPF
jgi:hypothetical protein